MRFGPQNRKLQVWIAHSSTLRRTGVIPQQSSGSGRRKFKSQNPNPRQTPNPKPKNQSKLETHKAGRGSVVSPEKWSASRLALWIFKIGISLGFGIWFKISALRAGTFHGSKLPVFRPDLRKTARSSRGCARKAPAFQFFRPLCGRLRRFYPRRRDSPPRMRCDFRWACDRLLRESKKSTAFPPSA
jgi:hypothetical protein